jgi:hypothetical protein
LYSALLPWSAIDGPIFHYEINIRCSGNINERIAPHGYNVGEFTRREHAKIRLLEHLGVNAGGGPQGANRTQSVS